MIRATEELRLIALAGDASARAVARRLGMKLSSRSGKIVVYGITQKAWRSKALSEALSRSGCARVFENMYLSKRGDASSQGELVRAFFDAVSSRYHGLITRKVNLGCYAHLLGVACEATGRAMFDSCLDLGCGPGTVLRSEVSHKSKTLVGFDFSLRMSRLASIEGLPVMSPQEFWEGTRTFQLIISSYVLHYRTLDAALLDRIAKLLSKGSVWAANFHKDMGLTEFVALLKLNTSLKLVRGPEDSMFGKVVVVALA